jgi:ferric-dicitrate binding protein FerR (iron transport regulator)
MENKDEIIQLVTGNLKCDPRDEVIAQLNTDEEARDEYNKIKNAWALVSSTNKMPEYQIESLYSDFRKQLDARQKSSRIFYLSVLKYAAMAIFVLSLGGLVGYYISMQNPQYADSGIQKNSSLKGSVSIVEFADGTKVWLNSGSQLTYREDHKNKQRIAELTGEGYFEVAHREDFPLLVKVGNIVVRDLGTTFNIKAYTEDNTIETSLVEGKAEILNTSGNLLAALKPGDDATYSNDNQSITVRPMIENVLSAWRDGKFVIRDQRLEDIFKEIGRWYDVEFHFESDKFRDYRYTGTIKKTTTAQHVLKMLKITAEFNYRIIDKAVGPDVVIIY